MKHDESLTSFNVLAIGWYGAPNVGDEVLLEILKTVVESKRGTLTVASVDPVLTREMHGVASVDFHNLGELARALLWADVLIMGGGGIFQDHHPFQLHPVYDPIINDISSYARPILMARQFGVPVVIWGHGVGPLTGADARDLVADIFSGVAAASVRDDKSLELLREIGVDRPIVVGADPGWLYKESCVGQSDEPPKAHDGKKKLAIVVREWSGQGGSWRDKLLSAIDRIVDDEWQISWVAFQANIRASGATSDLQLLEDIRKDLPDRLKGKVLLPRTPREAWDMLASSDAIFSMRLHASILGLLAKKPLVGLEYDDKMVHAHGMAGVPETQRLSLDDPEERYVDSLRILTGKSGQPWVLDDARIAELERSAHAHLTLLDHVPPSAASKKRWASGKFNWLATWLQQAIADLRETKERSRAAHELLQYRDYMLSERDAKLESMRVELTALQGAYERAEHRSDLLSAQLSGMGAGGLDGLIKDLHQKVETLEGQLSASREEAQRLSSEVQDKNEERTRLAFKWQHAEAELAELQQVLTSRSEELSGVQALLDQEAKRSEAREERLVVLESDLQSRNENIVELNERLRVLKLEWRESLDEVDQKNLYIADKEMYIAHLIARVTELEGQTTRLEQELQQAQNSWLHVSRLAGGAGRRLVRVMKMPFKFVGLSRRHGLRIAVQQSVHRLSGRRSDVNQATVVTGHKAPIAVVPQPVRNERLLVICHELMAKGWPTRPMSLIKAATRAGFFVRWYSSAVDVGHGFVAPDMSLLRTDEAGLLGAVLPETRVLLADLSPASINLAKAARARGGEVIIDLSSVDMGLLADDLRVDVASLVSRAVSHDGAVDPRLPSLKVDSLPDAADNEEFDSYKSYAYPDGFRKRRRNILVFATDPYVQEQLAELLSVHPYDQIHLVGQVAGEDSRIRVVEWHPSTRASLLAAADVVVVVSNAADVSEDVRESVRSALIMERPVISDVPVPVACAKNFHLLGSRPLSEAVDLATSIEDYGFVSANAWLARAEQLMQANFPRSVSVVVLIHNNQKIIERCVSTILAHCGAWIHEIVVVDNQSSDGGAELVERLYAGHPKVKLVRNTENGCSSGRNLGVKESTGEYIAFFDSDQWLTSPSCFAEAIYVLENNPDVGTIGWNAGWFDAQRDDLGGAISDYVPNRGMNADAQSRGYRDDVGFLGTSGMFIKRELFERIEGFDTFYDPTCFEDTDICFQVKKAGYAVAFRDLAGIRHQPHQTTGASEGSERYKKLFNRNAEYFRKKWEAYPGFFVDYRS